jgi:hypothetical protein
MENFFLFLEIMIPVGAGLLILKKGSLSIVFMPTIYFANTLMDETKYIPGNFYYYFFILLLLYFVFFNLPLFKRNVFANLIILYYIILAVQVEDFKSIERIFLGVIWLFVAVSLIPEVYKDYSQERIFQEVSLSAFAMMSLFVVNVAFSTYFGYNPYAIYGIKSGVLFGKMSSDIYNIFPFAIFIILRKGVKENNVYYLVLYFVSIFLVLLTMRRTVMGLSLFGSMLVLIELVKVEEIRKFILYGLIIAVVASVVILNTSFVDQFVERYEQRNLEERALEKENRLMEFDLVYKDLFVYEDYDPVFGFGLLNSAGNYGKKVFGDRTLHTDPMNLIHSSGFLGLGLYLLMFAKVFLIIWARTYGRGQVLQYMFITLCFLIFFINGRYTTTPSMLLMLLVFYIPLAQPSEQNSRNDLVDVGSKLL